ncbi:MAG: carboxypeptidase regulatory-like domain-containing protein, partial [Bryobacteraceae bacterium]
MIFRSTRTQAVLLPLLLLLVFASRAVAQPATGTLTGQVTDPDGDAVQNASVLVKPASGNPITATTGVDGKYTVKNLAPGKYGVQVLAKGFAIFAAKDVAIAANQVQTLDAALDIQQQQETVEVEADTPSVDVSPENNAGAIVLKQEDLQELSDDPDELQNDLEALAGPSAGPNGGQIYIDGFTAGQLPPKSAIREVRINQNPFSSEYDKLGYGRIEIFTKPGADQWHGNIQVQGNDSAFNSQNPFARGAEPGYDSTLFNGNIGGPIGSKASFFFAAQYRDINDVAVVNAETLDSNFNPTPFVSSVPQPRTRLNLAPRVDYQLTKDNTLSVRYQYYRDNQDNLGLTGFQLPSQAYNTLNTEQTVQVTDTQVINANLLNETHFQYLRDSGSQIASSLLPGVMVPGSFTAGGNNQQNVIDLASHYELQNYTMWVHGNHTMKFGVRLRQTTDTNDANSNFNGNYVFGSLSAYQSTEENPAQPVVQQFSITTGTPRTYVSTFDSGWYAQDDWRARPNLTVSAGLRLEQQTGMADHLDWAPRLGIAWGIGHGKTAPKTVLRVGSGLFYDRFTENLILQAERLNGVTQTQYVITNPCFFSASPLPIAQVLSIPPNCTSETILPTRYQISPRLHAPGTLQSAVTVERQVSKSLNISISYLNSRGFDQLLTNNINTPLPGKYIPGTPTPAADYPDHKIENVYQFQNGAVFRQNQLISQTNYRWKSRISLRAYYVLNYAKSDTSGPTSFSSNPYDISEDYGRASFDNRHRVFAGGSVNLPHGVSLFPFLLFTSGTPYSVTISQDLIGSSQFNQRPAYAGALSNPAGVVVTPFGSFDTNPQPGETIVPINSLTGPSHFSLNMRLSKTWGFGRKTSG